MSLEQYENVVIVITGSSLKHVLIDINSKHNNLFILFSVSYVMNNVKRVQVSAQSRINIDPLNYYMNNSSRYILEDQRVFL